LAVFYFSTDGDNWASNHTDYFGSNEFFGSIEFLTESDTCAWNDKIGGSGVFCGDGLNVQKVTMNSVGLNGTIPWELSLLADLSSLYLSGEDLFGLVWLNSERAVPTASLGRICSWGQTMGGDDPD
jgi:hypothetical protein